MKKSKFQQRLDEAAKKYNEEARKQSSQTAQPPNPLGFLTWNSVQDSKPIKHTYVNIWDGQQVLYNWMRVECENGDYYVDDNNMIKYDVTHWTYPYGYDPNKGQLEDDTKVFSVNDINKIITDVEDKLILNIEMPQSNNDAHLGYNTAVREIVKHLKQVARDGKV